MTAPLERWWQDRVPVALSQGIDLLDSEPDDGQGRSVDIVQGQPRQRDADAIIAFLASLFLERILSVLDSFNNELSDEVDNASNSLLRDGAVSLGLSFDRTRFAQDPIAARNDLMTLMRGRIGTRTADLRELAQIYLTEPSIRRGTLGTGRGGVLASGRSRPQTRDEWLDEMLRILGVNTREWVPFSVDQWAYRWFVIGQVRGARAAGITRFFAVNNFPTGPDSSTTPFCSWVHGRLVQVRKIEDQIDRHVRASLARDIDQMMGNWPLIGRVANEGSPETWGRLFNRTIGLPPYHARCRTTIQIKSPRS